MPDDIKFRHPESWTFEFPDTYKNGELSKLLYNHAVEHLMQWGEPLEPLTRRERWRWWVGEKIDRVRRAWEALRGLDDDWD